MAGHNSWRQSIDFGDWMRQIEKRLLNVERQPVVTQGSDLLGPGAAPHAVLIVDWNSDEATFVGVFYGTPDEGQVNSPDDTKFWIGETFGTVNGDGFQRLTEFSPIAIGSPAHYERRFSSPGGVRVYSAWMAL